MLLRHDSDRHVVVACGLDTGWIECFGGAGAVIAGSLLGRVSLGQVLQFLVESFLLLLVPECGVDGHEVSSCLVCVRPHTRWPDTGNPAMDRCCPVSFIGRRKQ